MKQFYHLLVNNLVASITNLTIWFALTFYVYLETKSVFATSIISGTYLVANTLSSFWFGSLVDNHKKKSSILGSNIITFAFFCASLILFALTPEETFKDITSPTLWIFVALLLIGVVVGNIRGIALPTIVTLVAPEESRDKANGLVGTTSGISFLIVSIISGLLIGMAGMKVVLILAVVLSFITIIDLLFTQIPENKVNPESHGQKKSMDMKGTIRIISAIEGLFPLIFFTTFNNFLGGVFMSLMDAYGLSLVSVETWGLLWGILSLGFIVGGLIIVKWGLGLNPLKRMFMVNIILWTITMFFTIQPSIILLCIGMFIYLCMVPYIEAGEQTIIQKVVPADRQGRVFGVAHSIESAASPLTAFAIGPIAQFIFIPWMSEGGAGAELIGSWFGTGPDRGMAVVFTLTGIIGFIVTSLALRTKSYKLLEAQTILVPKEVAKAVK